MELINKILKIISMFYLLISDRNVVYSEELIDIIC